MSMSAPRELDHKSLTAESLVIRNSNGDEIAYLGASTAGSGLFHIYHKAGTRMTGAGVHKDDSGGLITLYNKTGEGIKQIDLDDYGNGVVGAYNRKGKGRTLESK